MACQFNLVLYGPVGTGKTHLAVALGRLACMRAIPVGFFTATGLLMRLRRAKRGRLDAELRQIARARLPVIDEFGYMPIDRTVRHGRLTGFEGGSYRSEHALMTRQPRKKGRRVPTAQFPLETSRLCCRKIVPILWMPTCRNTPERRRAPAPVDFNPCSP